MATHASAEKRARQSEKRAARNRLHRGAMRTEIKKFRAAAASGDVAAATAAAKDATSALARTKSHGVIHKKTAARRISRIAKALNRVAAETAPKKVAAKRSKKAEPKAKKAPAAKAPKAAKAEQAAAKSE
jgi:small subunit ribosomal protein S20